MAKLTLSFKDKKLKIFPLLEDEILVGRDPGCQIHIDSLAVQPRHVVIRREGDQWRVAPAGDSDKVTVNNQPLDEHLLADGDHIKVGKHLLTFSDEAAGTATVTPIEAARNPAIGWLQIMNGSHLGRTIRLDRAMTRIGKSGRNSAMIARRKDGYYISHLEGDAPPSVNGHELGPTARRLMDGDRLTIGRLELHFFLDSDASAGAPAPVPSEEQQQRAFSRIPFEADVKLIQEGREWQGRLRDLSLKGALVERPQGWDEGSGGDFVLEIALDGGVVIRMDVEVAHVEEDRIGFHCKDIDLDSVTHLRRLVELNLADPALLERELAALG